MTNFCAPLTAPDKAMACGGTLAEKALWRRRIDTCVRNILDAIRSLIFVGHGCMAEGMLLVQIHRDGINSITVFWYGP